MTVLIIVLALACLITFILRLKVGLCLKYINGELTYKYAVGFLRIEEKEEKSKTIKKITDTIQAHVIKPTWKEYKPWVKAILSHWSDVIEMIGRVLTTLTFEKIHLDVEVGGEDPAECAIAYGEACAAVCALTAPIENMFTIKKYKINVNCCYDRKDMKVEFTGAIRLRVYQLISLLFGIAKITARMEQDMNMKTNVKVVKSV